MMCAVLRYQQMPDDCGRTPRTCVTECSAFAVSSYRVSDCAHCANTAYQKMCKIDDDDNDDDDVSGDED